MSKKKKSSESIYQSLCLAGLQNALNYKVMVTLPVLTRFEFLFVIDSSVCFLIGLYYISWMLGEKADCMQSSKKIPHWNFFYKKKWRPLNLKFCTRTLYTLVNSNILMLTANRTRAQFKVRARCQATTQEKKILSSLTAVSSIQPSLSFFLSIQSQLLPHHLATGLIFFKGENLEIGPLILAPVATPISCCFCCWQKTTCAVVIVRKEERTPTTPGYGV